MKKFINCLVAIVALLRFDGCFAETAIDIQQLKFKSFFAHRAGDDHVYCLLGTGFFVSMRSDNVDTIITTWLAANPNAKVMVVDTMPIKRRGGAIDYIWVYSGTDYLNIDLVREGAFPGGVMIDSVQALSAMKGGSHVDLESQDAPRRLVDEVQYKEFLNRVVTAEESAKMEHRGVWADTYKELREEQGVM